MSMHHDNELNGEIKKCRTCGNFFAYGNLHGGDCTGCLERSTEAMTKAEQATETKIVVCLMCRGEEIGRFDTNREAFAMRAEYNMAHNGRVTIKRRRISIND